VTGRGPNDVWTATDVAALEVGVKGGKWYSLIDKLNTEATLRAAFMQVEQPGRAGVIMSRSNTTRRGDANLRSLSEAVRTGSYRPQHIRRHYIPKRKPGDASMGDTTVRDRVVQTALAHGDGTSSSGTSLRTATAFAPVGLQGRAAAGGRTARGGTVHIVECRSEELLSRHHPRRTA